MVGILAKEESKMLNKKQLEFWRKAVDQGLDLHMGDIERLSIRQNVHVEDMAEFSRRIEELEGRLAFFTARHNRITEPAAQERNELARRLEAQAEVILKLTKLTQLEKEG